MVVSLLCWVSESLVAAVDSLFITVCVCSSQLDPRLDSQEMVIVLCLSVWTSYVADMGMGLSTATSSLTSPVTATSS